MSATELVLRLIALFDRLSIPYMMVGSYSSNYYGRPRSNDVALAEEKLAVLRRELVPDFQFDPQMSFKTITMTTRHVITHAATAFKSEMFLLTDDPHDQSRFARRRQVDFDGCPVFLPTPEDVIIQKLRWSRGGKRAKDLTDAAEVIEVQRANLDLASIRHWTALQQTSQLFEGLYGPRVQSQ